MAKHLTAERLLASIQALSKSRAKNGLIDFLIVKRSLKIKGSNEVAITQSEKAYTAAAEDLAGVGKAWNPPGDKTFVNVLGVTDQDHGFRTKRWLSNGTNTTIGSLPWRAVLDFSPDKPRRSSLRPGYLTRLATMFLVDSKKDKKPNLFDFGVWALRHENVEPLFASITDPSQRAELLAKKFVGDYGLTDDEVNILFDGTPQELLDGDLADVPADPQDYLVGLQEDVAVPLDMTATVALCSRDLVVALAAKPFVIMTGPSGTGKTRSTLRLAEQLQTLYSSELRAKIFRVVPIGSDWTTEKKLLGYRTPFGAERARPDGTKTNESYEITETLRIILRACNPNSTKVPHFLVFDEMNLSHVERYFAPFLSLMEASSILDDGDNAPIVDRHSIAVISELLDLENKDSVEAESARMLAAEGLALRLPPNLFYVGTVNVDETTYMFSPKVLDRAHVLEVTSLTPRQYVEGSQPDATIELELANRLLREGIDEREAAREAQGNPSAVLDQLVKTYGVDPADLEVCKELTLRVLDGCYHLLSPAGFEFAYRVVQEVHGYLFVWTKAQLALGRSPADVLEFWVAGLDRAVFQKILPKIHGNRAALGDCLKALDAFLSGQDGKGTPPARYTLGAETVIEIEAGQGVSLPSGSSFKLTTSKLRAMHDRLMSRNHVSFAK